MLVDQAVASDRSHDVRRDGGLVSPLVDGISLAVLTDSFGQMRSNFAILADVFYQESILGYGGLAHTDMLGNEVIATFWHGFQRLDHRLDLILIGAAYHRMRADIDILNIHDYFPALSDRFLSIEKGGAS